MKPEAITPAFQVLREALHAYRPLLITFDLSSAARPTSRKGFAMLAGLGYAHRGGHPGAQTERQIPPTPSSQLTAALSNQGGQTEMSNPADSRMDILDAKP